MLKYGVRLVMLLLLLSGGLVTRGGVELLLNINRKNTSGK